MLRRLGLFRLKSDSPKEDMSLWQVLTSGSDDVGGANLYKAKNPKKYIQVKTQTINGGSELITICSDITHFKELEGQSKKMRSIFFSSVAHELRTPLNSIIPLIKMILENMKLEQRVSQYLQIILNSSLHLQNVIEDALDMSRLENNKFSIFKELCDIKDAIKQVCAIMKFQVTEKKLALNVEISEKVPAKIYTDQKRYKQVLFNLLGNAIKFTYSGSLSVSIDFVDNNLISTVKDTGIGMSNEDLTQLFKFFGQISKSKDINRGGMGLGLTISKMILQQLQGTIQVESKTGLGSTFTFKIPIDQIKNAEVPRDQVRRSLVLSNRNEVQ